MSSASSVSSASAITEENVSKRLVNIICFHALLTSLLLTIFPVIKSESEEQFSCGGGARPGGRGCPSSTPTSPRWTPAVAKLQELVNKKREEEGKIPSFFDADQHIIST